jgi:hypothetical protein
MAPVDALLAAEAPTTVGVAFGDGFRWPAVCGVAAMASPDTIMPMVQSAANFVFMCNSSTSVFWKEFFRSIGSGFR